MSDDAGAAPFAPLLQARRGGPVALLHGGGQGPTWLCTEPLAELTLPAGGWPIGSSHRWAGSWP